MNHLDTQPMGNIINIQHFCTDDGPGIRTTVFFKGCPLRCVWCHNPESHNARTELMYRAEKCRSCGACVSVCPSGAHSVGEGGTHLFSRDLCTSCHKCADVCVFQALETVGEKKSVDEVLAELLSDRIFYETSGGGVTLSGGEPTAQPTFVKELLSACKREGLHTAMETCGFCSGETLMQLAPLVDLFLLDWKISDDALHQRYTGVSNQPIVENLARLDACGARVILRCPLIPDINLTEDHYLGIAALANRFRVVESIDLEPYHPMGVGKTQALGREVAYQNGEFLNDSVAEAARNFLVPRVSVNVRISGK